MIYKIETTGRKLINQDRNKKGMKMYLNATKNGLINQRFVSTPLLIFFCFWVCKF